MKKSMLALMVVLVFVGVSWGEWVTLPDLPDGRSAALVAVPEPGVLFVFGGTNRFTNISAVVRFDAATGWREVGALDNPARGGAVALIGADVYLLGGEAGREYLDTGRRFDASSGQFTGEFDLPVEMYGHRAAVVGGKIYATGGADRTEQASSACREYTPGTDRWAERASMTTGRKHHASVAANGKVYVFGGVNNDGATPDYLRTAEVFDPVANTWSAIADLPTTFWGGAAGVVADRIRVCGGFQDGEVAQACLAYDPAGDSWSTVDAAPFAAYRVAATAGALVLVGGERIGARGHETLAKVALWREPAGDDDDDDDNDDDDDDNDDDNC